MRKTLALVLAAPLLAALALGVAQAPAPETQTAPDAAAQTDPKADSVLKEGLAYMKGLDAASVRLALTANIKEGESDNVVDLELFLRWQGEGSLYSELTHEQDQAALITDGTDTYFYKITEKRYREERDRPRMELMGVYPGDIFGAGMEWLAGYAHGVDLLEGSTRSYVGEEAVGEGETKVACHRLRFENEGLVLDAWIEKGERPLPHRIEVDFAKTLAGIEDPSAPKSAKTQLVFADWEPNAKLDPAIFAFKVPEGVTKEEPRAPQSHPLIGQAAPDLKLTLLDGGEMTLASHKDKQVVVLDFWATWCGPCRMGLPMVDEAATTLKDESVAFYAVNIQESPEQVKQFKTSMELDLTVAMDLDGQAAQAYGAFSIPQTVIIGKDGVVKNVHQGVMPGYGDMLVQEVRELLK